MKSLLEKKRLGHRRRDYFIFKYNKTELQLVIKTIIG